jgi:hypothetical protein
MKKRIFYLVFTLTIFLTAGCFFTLFFKNQIVSIPIFKETTQSESIFSESASLPQDNTAKKTLENPDILKITTEKPLIIDQKIEQTAPFIVQAPLGNWSDPNFQNACEEASIVMAMGYVKGEKNLTPEEARKRILAIIDFENTSLGYSVDTDTADIEKIIQKYFNHKNATAKENITAEDIKTEIQKGNVVIVPAFGRALKNPNFTQPGPITHMLLIIGYDPETQEFITNDPGTRRGAGYRYDESALFNAIWEYPSGKNHPSLPTEKIPKAMISVGK